MGKQGGWPEAIEGYVNAAKARGFSATTIRLRRWQLDWLAIELDGVGPWDVEPGDLERVLAVERWSPETRRSRLSAARSFYRWAHRSGVTERDVAAVLPPVRVPAGKPRPCPESVLQAALDAVEGRVRLMMLLGAYCGLRASEIARVHHDDLADDDRLRVTGKGGKVRIVPVVHPELLAGIRASTGWLFPGLPGKPMTAGYVTKLLSAALPDGWTAHTLRHRMGTRAYAGTRDLLAVQELLGHARPETTRRYVLVPDDAVLAAVRAAA